jgi:hypothetical protein
MVDVVEELRGVDGGRVRVVALLDSLDYEVLFVRDDLRDVYSADDLEHAYRSIMAGRLSAHDFSEVGELGDVDCQLFVFERVVVLLFASSRYGGLFVSFDREKPFPLLEIVETVGDVARRLDDDATDD